jgi:hypothetical protein
MKEEDGARGRQATRDDTFGRHPVRQGRLAPDGMQGLEQTRQGLDVGSFCCDVKIA